MKLTKLNPKGFSHTLVLVAVVVVAAVGGTWALVGSHADANTHCINKIFSQGSSGHCVQDIQVLANSLSVVSPKLATDGQYGAKTVAGVKQIQKKYNDSVDGVVGFNTWRSICIATWPGNKTSGSVVKAWNDAYCDPLTEG